MLSKLIIKIREHRTEIILTIAVLVIAGLAHGINMFKFPYFENDEGTYLAQAWSLIKMGKLAPYTYWYDHAPGGWILTALWLIISGGVFKFGFSLNSGRVLMLLIHLLSAGAVLQIGKKITGKYQAGIISVIVFSLTPLGIYFQRRLLLDNIMIFWVLLAYLIILGKGKKLGHYFLSAVIFGIAVLTKENAIFFIPGFLYTIYFNAHPRHKTFATWSFLAILGFTASVYVLYAFLKNELFVPGSIFGGFNNHVSLIQTLQFQFSRSGGSFFKPTDSMFWKLFYLWLVQDKVVIGLGLFCHLVLTGMAITRKNTKIGGLCILGLGFWYFLARGGLVIEFYILPLIPLLSLYIGIVTEKIAEKKSQYMGWVYLIFIGYYFIFGQVSRAFPQTNAGANIYTTNQTAGQLAAVEWIRANVETSDYIAIDQYSYIELHDPENPSGKIFPNAIWYLKADNDPEVEKKLGSGSQNIFDLVAKTPQMQVDLWGGASPTINNVMKNSVYVKGFNTNGWGVEMWSNQNFEQILSNTWDSYKETFLKDGEKTVDPMKANITTSEGQSYAMLRSVWQSDRVTFDRVWRWTKNNLQRDDGTFSWEWGRNKKGLETILDTGSASDADTDIGLSLLFAYKKWGDATYLINAQKVISGIWSTDIRKYRGTYYLTPGNWAATKPELVINVSYLSPFAYRMFSEVDPTHNWTQVVNSAYDLLFGCTEKIFPGQTASAGLPPNWCLMTPDGKITASSEPGISSTDYTYDAVRTMWRIGLDYRWYGENRAYIYLNKAGMFFKDYWDTNQEIAVGYTHEGKPLETYESVLAYSAVLPIFTNTSQETALIIYQEKILPKLFEDKEKQYSYWESTDNYYLQNWAWFNIAYYANQLPNLWER